MEASFWLGIAGLISTLCASGIGFYFTYRAQRSPLRQQLYSKQLELLISFTLVATRIQMVADVFRAPQRSTTDELNQAHSLWGDLIGDLLEVTQKSGVVMPSEIYSAMTAYRASADDFTDAVAQKKPLDKPYYDLMGAAAHSFMLGRELVGADNLSVESLKLHSADQYKAMQQIGRVALAKVSRALWTRGGHS